MEQHGQSVFTQHGVVWNMDRIPTLVFLRHCSARPRGTKHFSRSILPFKNSLNPDFVRFIIHFCADQQNSFRQQSMKQNQQLMQQAYQSCIECYIYNKNPITLQRRYDHETGEARKWFVLDGSAADDHARCGLRVQHLFRTDPVPAAAASIPW